jgi:hypothetical protein
MTEGRPQTRFSYWLVFSNIGKCKPIRVNLSASWSENGLWYQYISRPEDVFLMCVFRITRAKYEFISWAISEISHGNNFFLQIRYILEPHISVYISDMCPDSVLIIAGT